MVAFIDLQRDGHIDRLFCAPEAVGRGVASRLYDAIETAARAQGIGRLFTEASELARRSFERKGFTVLERQEMILRGMPIHNYRMTGPSAKASREVASRGSPSACTDRTGYSLLPADTT